jgi:hypothetical protein
MSAQYGTVALIFSPTESIHSNIGYTISSARRELILRTGHNFSGSNPLAGRIFVATSTSSKVAV